MENIPVRAEEIAPAKPEKAEKPKKTKLLIAAIVLAAVVAVSALAVTAAAVHRAKLSGNDGEEAFKAAAEKFMGAYLAKGPAAYIDFAPESYLRQKAAEKGISVPELKERYVEKWPARLATYGLCEYIGSVRSSDFETRYMIGERYSLSEAKETKTAIFKTENGAMPIEFVRIGDEWYLSPRWIGDSWFSIV